jgi:hypothetical protein
MEPRRATPAADCSMIALTGDAARRAVSKATVMADQSREWMSVEAARLVAQQSVTLKTSGHENICFKMQRKVMDGGTAK